MVNVSPQVLMIFLVKKKCIYTFQADKQKCLIWLLLSRSLSAIWLVDSMAKLLWSSVDPFCWYMINIHKSCRWQCASLCFDNVLWCALIHAYFIPLCHYMRPTIPVCYGNTIPNRPWKKQAIKQENVSNKGRERFWSLHTVLTRCLNTSEQRWCTMLLASVP